MNLIDFINDNLDFDNPLLTAVTLFIIYSVISDSFHYLFSAVLSWFKKKK